MHRLALVLPFLFACGPKPASTAPAQPVEETTPAPEEPDADADPAVDQECYDACFEQTGSEEKCDTECGEDYEGEEEGIDGACYNACMDATADDDQCTSDCS